MGSANAAITVAGVTRGKRNPLHYGLADRLKRARQRVEWTRNRLSLAAGLSNKAAALVEDGGIPRLDVAERLARAVGLDPCFLCFGVYGVEVFRVKIPREEQSHSDPQPVPAPLSADAQLSCDKIGERLRRVREQRGLSRAALGRAAAEVFDREVAMSHSAIGYVEEGRTMPSVASVEALALVLTVSPCWLGFGVGEGPGEA